MAQSLADGNRIDYTPGSDVAAGSVIVQGDLVGVADLDIPANTLGALSIRGLKLFPKATGGSTAIAAGAKCYWLADPGRATTDADSGSNKYLGVCARAAADGDATVQVVMGQPA